VDVPIPRARRRGIARRRYAGAAAAGLILGAVSWWTARFAQPRLETLERAAIWTGTVERSSFVVRVRGTGTLRPESIRWLTAESSGRVEEVLVKPGATVERFTPVVRLDNLDLELQAAQAARELLGARADVLALERQTRRERLDLLAELETLRTSALDAERRARAYADSEGAIVGELDAVQARDRAANLRHGEAVAEQRAKLLEELAPRQLETLRQQTTELASVHEMRRQLVERLLVRAGASGILQDVPVELGQWVVPGTPVAKVIVDRRLEAELRVPAELAGALAVGQSASVHTGSVDASASIRGHVRRVAPAASEGTVLVEIALDGALPESARPDQNVDGSIETERTAPTLHVARPVNLGAGSTSSLFRLDPVTQIATRVEVRTGRVSVDRVEVVSGLAQGDQVILSDVSRYAQATALRIE
jgi:HlyD family secretion protein